MADQTLPQIYADHPVVTLRDGDLFYVTVSGTFAVDSGLNYSTLKSNLKAYTDTLYPSGSSSLYAPASKGVTNGDSHNHSGGDGADLPLIPTDGWNSVSWTSPTRTGATTFTVAQDVTGIIQKGYKLKLTDTTVKQFVVYSAVYSAGVTTITTIATTDFALVGNPSSIYWSNIENPFSWQDWYAYTPTWTAVTTNPTNYTIIGFWRASAKGIFAKIRATCNTSFTEGVGLWNFSLPIAAGYAPGSVALESAAGNGLHGGTRYALSAFVRSSDMRGIYANGILGAGIPHVWVATDIINLSAFYEF